MRTTLTEDSTRETLARLGEANREFAARYPGESLRRSRRFWQQSGSRVCRPLRIRRRENEAPAGQTDRRAFAAV